MNFASRPRKVAYSDHARDVFSEIDHKTSVIFDQVRIWRGWAHITSPQSSKASIIAVAREIFRAVDWYQSHTTEAGFHMFGRLPKDEVKLIQQLCNHKAIEAEHGIWAREDHGKLGSISGSSSQEPASPATFAVAAVWWRMAQIEEPFGYLGAEYLFEQLTAMVTQAALPIINSRDLPRDGLRFVIEHATEDAKHATFLKHLILDVVTRHPSSSAAMLRCFDYFNAVYPLPVWDEAYLRAVGPEKAEL